MPEWLMAGLATPGLIWLVAAAFLSGIVYGFAGFGSALIFMPLATVFVPPLVAVASFGIAALGSVFSVLPQALGQADRRASGVMLGAALVAVPFGVWVLRAGDPVALRWAVSLVVLGTLAALVTGWRYRGTPGLPAWLGVGSAVGFMGGSVGLNGPALVLFQLGGSDPVVRIRANTIVVLTISGIASVPVIALQGALPLEVVVVGFLLMPIYLGGTVLGRALFDPARARLYRRVAYGIIGVAGLIGLPVFG